MGFMHTGGWQFYDGPNEAAAGASAFGDNFLKAYLGLQANSRENAAQDLKERIAALQISKMQREKAG